MYFTIEMSFLASGNAALLTVCMQDCHEGSIYKSHLMVLSILALTMLRKRKLAALLIVL